MRHRGWQPGKTRASRSSYFDRRTMMTRILVVDDVPVVRLVICKILRRAGHVVQEAANGDDAMVLVKTVAPDAVITDLWMPGSDGLSLIRAMKIAYPTIAVIAMTGGSPRDS